MPTSTIKKSAICCLGFFGKYVVPHAALGTVSGALSGYTGNMILDAVGSPGYFPLEGLEIGAVGGAILGSLAGTIYFCLDNLVSPILGDTTPNARNIKQIFLLISCCVANLFFAGIVGHLAAGWFFKLVMSHSEIFQSFGMGGLVLVIPMTLCLCACYVPVGTASNKCFDRLNSLYRIVPAQDDSVVQLPRIEVMDDAETEPEPEELQLTVSV